jgi:hypothetical protein
MTRDEVNASLDAWSREHELTCVQRHEEVATAPFVKLPGGQVVQFLSGWIDSTFDTPGLWWWTSYHRRITCQACDTSRDSEDVKREHKATGRPR